MIQGFVSQHREAILPLVLGGASGQRQVVDAVIETGFNDRNSLKPAIIVALDSAWNASDIVTFGNGSETLFDLYAATVIWDGQCRETDVAESETEPLIGMTLLPLCPSLPEIWRCPCSRLIHILIQQRQNFSLLIVS